MNYRKLIEEQISKLHTAKGIKANPLLNSDLGAAIVENIVKIELRKAKGVNTIEPEQECGTPYYEL